VPITKFLLSPDNPKGWKLEDALQQIQNDILRRSTLIADDRRSEARAVLHNNCKFMNLITECIKKPKNRPVSLIPWDQPALEASAVSVLARPNPNSSRLRRICLIGPPPTSQTGAEGSVFVRYRRQSAVHGSSGQLFSKE